MLDTDFMVDVQTYIKNMVAARKNLFYYDVNSLYPTVMLKPMPIKPLEWLQAAANAEKLILQISLVMH